MSDDEQNSQPPSPEKSAPPADKEEGSEHINIKVQDSEGGETFFKIKMSTKLGKLMNAYAQRTGKDPNTVRFTVDGNKIKNDDTPKILNLDDNDTIEVHIEQVGGMA